MRYDGVWRGALGINEVVEYLLKAGEKDVGCWKDSIKRLPVIVINV